MLNLLAPKQEVGPTKGFAPDVYPLVIEGDGKPRPLLQDFYAEQLRRDASELEILTVLWKTGQITEDEFLVLAMTL